MDESISLINAIVGDENILLIDLKLCVVENKPTNKKEGLRFKSVVDKISKKICIRKKIFKNNYRKIYLEPKKYYSFV